MNWGNKAMKYGNKITCPVCGEEDVKVSPSQKCCRKESCKKAWRYRVKSNSKTQSTITPTVYI